MATSWADQWRAVLLELAQGDGDQDVSQARQAARTVAQGRAYHQGRRVTDLRVVGGTVSGRVQGRRATARLAEVLCPQLGEAEWDVVLGALAGQLRHSARLLGGVEPEGLVSELEQEGLSLLPRAGDVELRCGCGGEQPCAHIAAVWEAAAEQLEADPFTLLRLRGRGRERVLADLAATRRQDVSQGHEGFALEGCDPGQWTHARAPLEVVELPPLSTPRTTAPALRALGDPPGWAGNVEAWELFKPLVECAAAWARAAAERPPGGWAQE